jgi:hypothetical protein
MNRYAAEAAQFRIAAPASDGGRGLKLDFFPFGATI